MLGGVAQLDFDCDFFAFAPYAEADFFSRRNGADHNGKVAGRTYFSAVEAEDDVARLQAGTFCGAAGQDFGNQCAADFVQTERLCQTVGYFLNNHAQLSALDFAGVFQLFGDIHGNVNRDGEGNAHESAAAAVYLRVDADDLSF